MSMRFDESTVGVWFIACEIGDLLSTINREEDGTYTLTQRVREYDPDSTDPHDGKDQKTWSTMKGRPGIDVDELVAGMARNTDLIEALWKPAMQTQRYVYLRSDYETYKDFLNAFMMSPIAHVKPVTGTLQ